MRIDSDGIAHFSPEAAPFVAVAGPGLRVACKACRIVSSVIDADFDAKRTEHAAGCAIGHTLATATMPVSINLLGLPVA